jgi:tetratricopeptide (TPR) repeat protein
MRCIEERLLRQRATSTRGLLLGGVLLALTLATLAPLPAFAQARDAEIFSQEEICRRRYQEGIQYKNNQQLQQAAERFTEVKEACPEMVEAYLNLGEIQVRLSQYQEAIDTYRDALDTDPGNLDVREHLAFALSSAGELDDALAMYLELHEARPERPEILRNLAFVYQQKGMIAEAVMLYNRLVELDEANARTVSQAGRLALDNHLYLPAVAFYKKLYEFDPNNVSTLHILAGYYFQIGFYDEALVYYDKLLEQDLSEAQETTYHKYRAYCRNKVKNFAGAKEDYEYLIAKEPQDVSHACNLAFACKDGGLLADARRAVQAGVAVHPDAGCLYYAWGVTLLAEATRFESQKKYDEALGNYEEARGRFQRVVDLRDANYGNAAGEQLGRIDALIERVRRLMEKEAANG